MLLPSLASILLASTSLAGSALSTPTDAGLLAALPADTLAAFHVPNPRALIASRETNRWVGFATDPEWDRLIGHLLAAVGDDVAPSEIQEWRTRALGAMEDSTGMVGFVSGDLSDGNPPTVGLILQGGDQCATLLRRFIGTDAQMATIEDGTEVLLSAAGRAELYYESEGLILILSTPTVEESLGIASECLDALSAGEMPALFSQPGVAERRSPEAAFEFAANLEPFWESTIPGDDAFAKRLLDSASTMKWVYGNGVLGLGEYCDWNIYVPFGQTSLIGKALGFFGQADKSHLSNAPAGSISATVGEFDISGFSSWALDATKEASEAAHAQAMAALSAVKSAVGVDILEDIIGPMTGHFFGFSSAPSADEANSLMALSSLGTTTFVAFTDDTDPLLDLVDSLVEMSGMGDAIMTERVSFGDGAEEMEFWRSDATTGLPITLGVGSGRLIISSDENGSQGYIDQLKGTEGARALLDDAELAKAVEAASGAIVTIQPTVAFADALEGLGELVDAMNPSIWLPDQDAEMNAEEAEALATMSDALGDVAALARQYFSGTTTTEVKIGSGLVQLHTLSQ